LVFPNFVTDKIIKFIAPIVSPSKPSAKWVTDEYLPEILIATKHNNIPMADRMEILIKLVGFLIKIGYAFAFQEQFMKIPGF